MSSPPCAVPTKTQYWLAFGTTFQVKVSVEARVEPGEGVMVVIVVVVVWANVALP